MNRNAHSRNCSLSGSVKLSLAVSTPREIRLDSNARDLRGAWYGRHAYTKFWLGRALQYPTYNFIIGSFHWTPPTASEGGACVGIHVNNKEKLTNKKVNTYKVSYKSLSKQSKTNSCYQYFQDNNLLSVFPSLITTFVSLSNDICINTTSPLHCYITAILFIFLSLLGRGVKCTEEL